MTLPETKKKVDLQLNISTRSYDGAEVMKRVKLFTLDTLKKPTPRYTSKVRVCAVMMAE